MEAGPLNTNIAARCLRMDEAPESELSLVLDCRKKKCCKKYRKGKRCKKCPKA
ncbi:MAG: hypothetical protein AAGB22_06610 [Bacteroidota bacterium]